jgi:hypothetical protein
MATSNEYLGIRLATEIGDAPLTDTQLHTTIYHIDGKLPQNQPNNSTNNLIYVYGRSPVVGSSNEQLRWVAFNQFNSGTLLFQGGETGNRNTYTIESIVYKSVNTTLAIIDNLSRPVFNKYIIPSNVLNASTKGTYNISWVMPNVDTLNSTNVTARLQVLESNYLSKTPITVEIRVLWRFESNDPQFPGSAGEPAVPQLFSYTIDTANVTVSNNPNTPLSTQSKLVSIDSHACSVDSPTFNIDFQTLLNGEVNSSTFTFIPPPSTDVGQGTSFDYFIGIPQDFLNDPETFPPGTFTIDPYRIGFKNLIANRELGFGTAVYGTTTPNSFTSTGLLTIRDTVGGFQFQLLPRSWKSSLNYNYTGNDQTYVGANWNPKSGLAGQIEVSFPVYIKDHIIGELITKDVTFIVDVQYKNGARDGIPRSGVVNSIIGVDKDGVPLPNYGNDSNAITVEVDESYQYYTTPNSPETGKWILAGEPFGSPTAPIVQRRFLRWVNSDKDLAAGEFKITKIELFDYDKWKGNFELDYYDFDTNVSIAPSGPSALFPLRILRGVNPKFQGRIHYEFRWSDSTGTCESHRMVDRFEVAIDTRSDYILDAKLQPTIQQIRVENENTNRVIEPYTPITLTVMENSRIDSQYSLPLQYVPNARLPGGSSTTELKRGEFSIINISGIVGHTLSVVDGNVVITPTQTQLVQPTTTVTVQIEAFGGSKYTTSLSAEIRRILPTNKVVATTSTPQTIDVNVDYNNNVLNVSVPSVSISARENDVNGQSQDLFYDVNLSFPQRYRIKSTSPISNLITQTTFSTRDIAITSTGIFTADQNILVTIEYTDSNNIRGEKTTTFRLRRIAPQNAIIAHTINPTSITLDTNDKTNLVIYPFDIPVLSVGLTERLNQTLPPQDLRYNPVIPLGNGEWRITNITGPNRFEVDTKTPTTPNFKPRVFSLPQQGTGTVFTEYVDSNGKPGTGTISFPILRKAIPNDEALVRFPTNLDYLPNQTQVVLVSDTFQILDAEPAGIYDELKDLIITGEELLKNTTNYTSLNYSDTLSGTSVWKVRSIRISNATNNQFVNYIGYELETMSKSVKIKFLSNEIRSKLKVEVFIDYIDAYMNDGTRTITHYIEPKVDYPIITKIEFPERINAADYIGFDVNFTVVYESKYTSQIALYILQEGTFNLYNNRRYGPNDTVQFNMKQLVGKYPIPTEDNDIYTFDMILVPERRETNGTITVGQKQTITIVFNKSNVQIDRLFIIQNLYDVIQPKFNFDVYRDETRKYLTHYLHMDNKEPIVIANWEKDSVTFSEYEEDDLGNQILIRENPTLVLKMYEPLPEDVQPNTSVWITKARS